MALKTLLVLVTSERVWVRDWELPIPPFVGLGIRIDTYEVLNVDSVVVGDRDYDVTCIVHFEGVELKDVTEKRCRMYGFIEGDYPY
jgi:hypothetical protein